MADITLIFSNLSRSIPSLEKLLTGFAYVLGILFFITALMKLRDVAEKKAGGGGEGFFVPMAYMFGGAALLYLPSMSNTIANTFFGAGNVLQYVKYEPYNLQDSIMMLIRFTGLVWFIRGCVLVTHASEPGVKHGPKGLMFIIAGIFAMNIESTQNFLTWSMQKLTTLTLGGVSL